jgi:hypothetical protein
MARQSRNMRHGIEEMKNILICDLFYRVAFNIELDHYLKLLMVINICM